MLDELPLDCQNYMLGHIAPTELIVLRTLSRAWCALVTKHIMWATYPAPPPPKMLPGAALVHFGWSARDWVRAGNIKMLKWAGVKAVRYCGITKEAAVEAGLEYVDRNVINDALDTNRLDFVPEVMPQWLMPVYTRNTTWDTFNIAQGRLTDYNSCIYGLMSAIKAGHTAYVMMWLVREGFSYVERREDVLEITEAVAARGFRGSYLQLVEAWDVIVRPSSLYCGALEDRLNGIGVIIDVDAIVNCGAKASLAPTAIIRALSSALDNNHLDVRRRPAITTMPNVEPQVAEWLIEHDLVTVPPFAFWDFAEYGNYETADWFITRGQRPPRWRNISPYDANTRLVRWMISHGWA